MLTRQDSLPLSNLPLLKWTSLTPFDFIQGKPAEFEINLRLQTGFGKLSFYITNSTHFCDMSIFCVVSNRSYNHLMGIVKPPWISNEFFRSCPFNYCDHFGNKEKLAVVCIICKEDIKRIEKYKKEGKDPFALENVFDDVAKNLAKTMVMVSQQAEEMGIDLKNLPDDEEIKNERFYENDLIFVLIKKYSNQIQKTIKNLEIVPIDADIFLIEKAINALSHSTHYIIAKIGRALDSELRESTNTTYIKSYDNETSAFLAYLAIERNSRALLALAKHKPLIQQKRSYLKLSKTSLKIAEMIHLEFFPGWELAYQEYGCEEYDQIFTL